MEGVIGIIHSGNEQPDQKLGGALGLFDSQTEIFTHKNCALGLADSAFGYNSTKSILAICLGKLEKDLDYNLLTDAEFVAQAYEKWGALCFEKISGSFAIVILDLDKDRLLLARDRIGKKSIFWYQDHHTFIFSTHLKALLTFGVPALPAHDALAAYLYFGYIPQDMSPILGINKVLPGHYVQYTLTHVQAIQQYWSYSALIEKKQIKPHDFSLKEAEDYLHQAMKHMIPINKTAGAFVLGGWGSATAAYYLKKNSSGSTLFHAEFHNENVADKKTAQQIAETLHLPFENLVITPETFLKEIVEIVWHLEEPQADPHAISIWELARMAAKKHSFVITGSGCDEIFATHNKYTSDGKLELVKHQIQKKIAQTAGRLAPWMNYFSRPLAFTLLRKSRVQPWQYDYLRKHALFDERELKAAAPGLAPLFDPKIFLRRFHRLHKIKSPVESFLYFDLKTRLPDKTMAMYDKLTQAHGLKWSSPFLDKNLVEYLAGHSTKETYTFFKGNIENIFPKSIVFTPKASRPDFLGNWTASTEFEKILPFLINGILVRKGLISEKWLRAVIAKPKLRIKHFSKLWAVFILEIWYRLFIERPVSLCAPKIKIDEL